MSAANAAKRLSNYALVALLATVTLDALIVGFGPLTLAGLALPGTVPLALLALALVAGAIAAVRRNLPALGVAVVALLVPALAERPWDMTTGRFLASVAFGFLTLVFAELVHASLRYEKWQKAAEATRTSNAADASLTPSGSVALARSDERTRGLESAASEYLRTFARVFAIAVLAAAAIGGLYAALLAWGPAQHRASLDYRSFYGLLGAALLAFGAVALVALARGADWSRPRAKKPNAPPTLPVDGEIVFHSQDQVVATDGPK